MNDSDERQLALCIERTAQQHGGCVPKQQRLLLMAKYKLSESTFYRRQRAILGTIQDDGSVLVRPRRFRFTPEMLPYFAPQRNRYLKDVHKELKADFGKNFDNFPSYEHFTKLVKREIDTDWYAEVRFGIPDGRNFQQRILDEHAEPGQRWSLDVKHTRAPVTPDGKYDPQWGWIISVLDHGTRKIAADMFVVGVVSARDILTVLGMAARAMGGMPEVLLYDNAGENLDAGVTDWVEKCETHIITINSHHKNENGKSENFNGNVLEDRCTRLFPNNSRSPVDINQAPYVAPGAPVIEASEARRLIRDVIDEYNDRVHGATGVTPNQYLKSARQEGQMWLFEVDAAHLRQAAMPDDYKKSVPGAPKGSKKIGPLGVAFKGKWYRSVTPEDDGADPALRQSYFSFAGKTGRVVFLRYWPDNLSRIEVFDLDGITWLCSAVPHKDVPTADKRSNAARNAAVDSSVRHIHQQGEDHAAARVKTVPRPDGTSTPVEVDEDRPKARPKKEKRPKASSRNKHQSHVPDDPTQQAARGHGGPDHDDGPIHDSGLRRIGRRELLRNLPPDDEDDTA